MTKRLLAAVLTWAVLTTLGGAAAPPAPETPELDRLEREASLRSGVLVGVVRAGRWAAAADALGPLWDLGRRLVAERERLTGEGRRSAQRLAGLFQQQRWPEARIEAERTLALWRRLYPADRYPAGHPDLARGIGNLGSCLWNQGDLAGAEPLLREAVAKYRQFYPADRFPQGHPDLAGGLGNLALLLRARGDLAGAEPLQRESLAMWRKLIPAARYPQGRPQLAQALKNPRVAKRS